MVDCDDFDELLNISDSTDLLEFLLESGELIKIAVSE